MVLYIVKTSYKSFKRNVKDWRKVKLESVIIALIFYFAMRNIISDTGQYNYPSIKRKDIKKHLFTNLATPAVDGARNLSECTYEFLHNDTWLNLGVLHNTTSGLLDDGEYWPKGCQPLYSAAILVTYRDRAEQIKIFLKHLHPFLQLQKIHYKIFIIEQYDNTPWNKGALYNIGAKKAIEEGYTCLILHDGDLLPMTLSNLYACTDQPRHMSASLDKFRFVLLYEKLFGGVVSIQADQFIIANGFSNRFLYWGGEDDDFASRISKANYEIIRFPKEMSTYKMLLHMAAERNPFRYEVWEEDEKSENVDGYNNVQYLKVEVTNHSHYELIRVTFQENRLQDIYGRDNFWWYWCNAVKNFVVRGSFN